MKYSDEYDNCCELYLQLKKVKKSCSAKCEYYNNCPKIILEEALDEFEDLTQGAISKAMQAMWEIVK